MVIIPGFINYYAQSYVKEVKTCLILNKFRQSEMNELSR
jgi:hypothetical protein